MNWQSFIYALQNPHRTIFKWSRKEKKVESTTATKYLYSFLMLFYYNNYYLFNDFCSRVANGQRYHTHSHTHTKFWAMACREFLILNSIAHCSVLVDTMGPSKRFYSFYFYFCFVLCLFSLYLASLKRQWDALWWENVEANKMECEKESSNLLQKLDRFNSFLFSCDAFEEKTSNRIR